MKHQNAELTFNAPWVAAAPNVFFFALFPAFFAYQALITMGIAGPLLPGGGRSIVNAAGVLVLGPVAVAALRWSEWKRHAAFVLLAVWAAIYAAAHFLWGAPWQKSPLMLEESAKLLAGWGCLYAIGYLIEPSQRFAKALLYSLWAMAAVTLLFMEPASLQHHGLGGATYQWFANAVAFTAIFCLALLPAYHLVVLGVTTAALFMLGSLSDLAGFLAVGSLWVLISAWRHHFAQAVSGTGIVILALCAAYAMSGSLPLLSNRALSPTITKEQSAKAANPAVLDKADSWKIRDTYQRSGWNAIKQSPLASDYGGQLRDHGSIGTYTHNALSAWRQFGLVPFLLYVGLTVSAASFAAWAVFVRRSTDAMWTLTLYVGGFTLLLIVASKSVFWPLPALAWGLLANCSSSRAITGAAFRYGRL